MITNIVFRDGALIAIGRAGKLVVYNTVAHKLAVAAFDILRDQVDYEEDLLFAS